MFFSAPQFCRRPGGILNFGCAFVLATTVFSTKQGQSCVPCWRIHGFLLIHVRFFQVSQPQFGNGQPIRLEAFTNEMSRGEQNRTSCVVSKTGLSLTAPPVLEEGERSDARRKDGRCSQARAYPARL